MTEFQFDYAALAPKTRTLVQSAEREIDKRLKRSAEDIREIGRQLIAVKESLEHGQFGEWIEARFGWSAQTANNMMSVAECFAKITNFGDLPIAASALYQIASPSCPDEVRQSLLERAESGEEITYTLAKEAIAEARGSDPKPDDDVISVLKKLFTTVQNFVIKDPKYREPMARRLIEMGNKLLEQSNG